MNNVVLIGRLTRDPELRYIPITGTAVCTFTIAVDKGMSKEKKDEAKAQNQPTADFINIVVWGKTAENCANFLEKGLLVGIRGRIQSRTYDKDGEKRYITEVVAQETEFLEWKKDSNTNHGSSFDGYLEGFHPVDSDDIPF